MNISSELVHFDAHIAVCAVFLQEGDMQVRVYASALATETPFFADLAQKRAIQLALDVQAKGGEAMGGLSYPEQTFGQVRVSPVRSEPVEAAFCPEVEDSVAPVSQPELNIQPDLPASANFSDEAPW